MIKPEDLPADVAGSLAYFLNAMLERYKRDYRSFVLQKLGDVRDGHPDGSPAWVALNDVLLRLGAGPRDPARERSATG